MANNESLGVENSVNGVRQGLHVGKSTVKGAARVTKVGVKGAVKAGKGVKIAITTISSIVGFFAAHIVPVVIVVVIICSIFAGQDQAKIRVPDPDLEQIIEYFNCFFGKDPFRDLYTVKQVDLNNQGKVSKVYDNTWVYIPSRNEFNEFDKYLLYACFAVYAKNTSDTSGSGGTVESGSDRTKWDNAKREWTEANATGEFEKGATHTHANYIMKLCEDVMKLFLYREDNGNPPYPKTISEGTSMALLVTDGYMQNEYDKKSAANSTQSSSSNTTGSSFGSSHNRFTKGIYTRNYNRIITNMAYIMDGNNTMGVEYGKEDTYKSIETAVLNKWATLKYGLTNATGGSIAGIAANEEVGTKGEKYWTGCQSWIKAIGGPVGADWCSIFVGWCIEQAGYDPADYAWSAGCMTWERQARSADVWESDRRSPQLGYAAIFNGGAHTGIVIEIFDGGIVCAEGNSGSSSTSPWYLGSSVQHNRHYYSSGDIDGYVKLPAGAINTDTGTGNGVSGIRTTPPQYGNKNYMPTNMGGYSPFTGSINIYPSIHGRGPDRGNCTAYAWGRVCEVYGRSVASKMPTSNACNWYGQWSGNKGQTPKPGAVAVWDDGSAGHVAFVEEVYSNGSILISQSAYNSYFFKSKTVSKANNYGYSGTFLGFIYPK